MINNLLSLTRALIQQITSLIISIDVIINTHHIIFPIGISLSFLILGNLLTKPLIFLFQLFIQQYLFLFNLFSLIN